MEYVDLEEYNMSAVLVLLPRDKAAEYAKKHYPTQYPNLNKRMLKYM